MSFSCGIDFGTSNSALSIAHEDGGVTLASVEGESVTLPSAVFYPASGAPAFGRAALHHFIGGAEGRFMRSLKRILGTPLMAQGTSVNGKNRKFEDILRDFIGHMKAKAETQAGQPLQNVVMGRPVHFIDGDSAADARAQSELESIARAAGFRHVEFQYEPIAAAFAHEQKIQGEKLALVADIGGGTSDFTVIRLSADRARKAERQDDILANSGVRVGGNDFDKDLCLCAFMPELGLRTAYGDKRLPLPLGIFFDMSEWSKVNFLYTPKTRAMAQEILSQTHAPHLFGRFVKLLRDETGHQLLAAVEDAKIALTESAAVTADLGFIETGLRPAVTRAEMDGATARHVESIQAAIGECLKQAGTQAGEIGLVVLTGGTTEVPAVRSAISQAFAQADISEGDKLSSVGLGLGHDSLRRFGGTAPLHRTHAKG